MATQTWAAWPDNPIWTWQVTRILGLIDFGAANFAEVWEVVQRIAPRDGEAWHHEWLRMGELVEAMAVEAEVAGIKPVARDNYARATQYYRLAQFFLPGDDDRKIPTLRRMKQTFEKGTEYFERPIERIEIPYEGTMLPGYFLPADTGEPAPTLIYLNGADSLSEEVYYTAGATMQEHGYNFLMFDAPGVGLTLYELGLPTRPDPEAFVSPVVDLLEQRQDVDRERIGLLGESFAGYLVPRAATFERRLKASVVWSPIYDLDLRHVLAVSPPAFVKHLQRLVGAEDADFEAKAAQYTLRDVAKRIDRPMLLIQGSEDWLIYRPIEAALRIAREAPSGLVEVRIVERDEGVGGATHCQKDNLHVAHLETLRWFDQHLRGPARGGAGKA